MKFLYLVIPLLILDTVDLSEGDLEVCCDDNVVYDDEIPKPEPLKGAVWPIPRTELKLDKVYKIGTTLDFELDKSYSWNDLLTNVTKRFLDRLNILRKYSNETKMFDTQEISVTYAGEIDRIGIYLKTCCEYDPHPNMSEYYKLKIRSNILINSYDVWGVIRALDTLLQLCYTNEYGDLVVNGNEIQDSPKYTHRGLMLDTETRYISVDNILKIVDAMAMNKLNVFHWRIAGDTSFPYESKEFSKLSKKGAFYRKMVYNASTIKKIYEFARIRGVMVVPEMNVPGHVMSIGKSHPEMLTRCYSDGPAFGPLDPRNSTISVVYKLVQELSKLVSSTCVHVGGEDIDTDCWASNPDVQDYLQKETKYDLHLHFLFDFDRRVARKLILAQDILKCKDATKNWEIDSLMIQAYSEDLYEKVKYISNYSVILSWPWDLSKRAKTRFLLNMYDEAAEAINKTVKKFLAGGEAYMMVNALADDTNIFDIVWPHVSVIADVLWHGLDEANDVSNETNKERIQRTIQEQTCRMVRFGIPVSPPGSGYCVLYDEENQSNATVDQKLFRKDNSPVSTDDQGTLPRSKPNKPKKSEKPRLKSNIDKSKDRYPGALFSNLNLRDLIKTKAKKLDLNKTLTTARTG